MFPKDQSLILFLICTNDLPDHLTCYPKPFANDVAADAVMHDDMYSTANLSADLKRIHDWSVSYKMLFNSDITKPAEGVRSVGNLETVSIWDLFSITN